MSLEIPSSTRRTIWWIGLVIVVLTIVNFGLGNWINERSVQVSERATVEGETILVASRVEGRVRVALPPALTQVAKGDVLVKLDTDRGEKALQKAEQDRNQAQEFERYSQSRLERLDTLLETTRDGWERNLVTAKDWKQIQDDQADAVAQDRLAVLLTTWANERRDLAATDLAEAVIRAPLDGVIAETWVAVGDPVRPGLPLCSVFDPESLWVNGEFGDRQLSRIRVGDLADVHVDVLPHETLHGTVTSVGVIGVTLSNRDSTGTGGELTRWSPRGQVVVRFDVRSLNRLKKSLYPGLGAEIHVLTAK